MSGVPTNKLQFTLATGVIYAFSSKGRSTSTRIAHSVQWYLRTFWARLGGVYQRLIHRLYYLPHAAFLCVDDMLLFQETQIIGSSAAVIAVLFLLTGLPISWKKCEMGATIVWIGWSFNLRAGFVTSPEPKRRKLLDLLDKLLASSHCSKKSLEKFLGLALWITQLWPEMRIWLRYLSVICMQFPHHNFQLIRGSGEKSCHAYQMI